MYLDLEIVNPLTYKNWDTLLETNEACTFFHSKSWTEILHHSYNYTPLYFKAENHKKLLALVPVMEIESFLTGKRGGSLPYTDICAPIIDKRMDEASVVSSILDFAQAANWKTFEFRGGSEHLNSVTPYMTFYRHDVDLTLGEEGVYSKFRSSTRRNIKKSVKAGITIELSTSLDALREYSRLNGITKKRHGIPAQPFSYFKNIQKYAMEKDRGIVAIARYNGEAIAGAIFFYFNGRVVYNYGASDKNFQQLRPNNLLMWETMKWCIEKGLKTFCFGITDLNNNGLRQFKTGMSTSEDTVSYYKYNVNKGEYIKSDSTMTIRRRQLFQKMPISFLRLSGALLYKHYG